MFIDPKYVEDTRTFTGRIDWQPTTFYGFDSWEFTMIFDKDFSEIEKGQIVKINKNGSKESKLYGKANSYQHKRLEDNGKNIPKFNCSRCS